MTRFPYLKILLVLFALAAAIVGCGGGEESTQASPPGPVALLSWTPPETTVDNTPIDPFEELDYYEIYVREDEYFNHGDVPVAQVAAVEILPSHGGEPLTKALVKEFDMNLLPNLPWADRLYVSLKAVGYDGQKSAFMEPVVWTRS